MAGDVTSTDAGGQDTVMAVIAVLALLWAIGLIAQSI
jgi:hypothetical protein